MDSTYTLATDLYYIYDQGYAFPEWILNKTVWHQFAWNKTVVFYTGNLEEVRQLMKQREPCNIGMRRYYNESEMLRTFGWKNGAYKAGSPNIAVYCVAHVKINQLLVPVKVINLIGCALDSNEQPDAKIYNTKAKVLRFYKEMWKFALHASIHSTCSKIKIFNVGGGAFAGDYFDTFISDIFEPAFLPLITEFEKHGITVLGYDRAKKEFNGGFIPRIFNDPTEDISDTLYVNAWDPWAIIGNGNKNDKSLDGYFGRCSNMSVLGWSVTNPYIQYEYVNM
jgi:hypothetical protein